MANVIFELGCKHIVVCMHAKKYVNNEFGDILKISEHRLRFLKKKL